MALVLKLSILHTESSMGWGGQEIRIVRESLGMMERGHRLAIAASAGSIIFRKAKESGIKALPLDFKKTNPLSVSRTMDMIAREQPDIINTHSSSDSWVATIAARLSRSHPKIIRTKHLSTPVKSSFSARLIYGILPHAVMTTGEEIRANMIRAGYLADKIVSVPTGIDLDRFDSSKTRPAFKPAGFAVGMVGVLRSWKGHQYLIQAIPAIIDRIPDAMFFIVGEGPQRPHLEEFIAGLPYRDKIVMLGHREDVPEIMAAMDVIVHPSFANEGVPQSVLQALAMERPVIASDAGAIKEVVINGVTGMLIEPRNSQQIAEKVIEIHAKPDLASSFGKDGRQLVENTHSVGHMLDRVEGLYHRLMRNA
jgi:glycosyltransferase involved in cell wall biosynthesis